MIADGHVFIGRAQVCDRAGCDVTKADVFHDRDMARDSRPSITRCVGL